MGHAICERGAEAGSAEDDERTWEFLGTGRDSAGSRTVLNSIAPRQSLNFFNGLSPVIPGDYHVRQEPSPSSHEPMCSPIPLRFARIRA